LFSEHSRSNLSSYWSIRRGRINSRSLLLRSWIRWPLRSGTTRCMSQRPFVLTCWTNTQECDCWIFTRWWWCRCDDRWWIILFSL